jgi:hypothetical protein
MSKDIDRLLQECLAGLDTGLTPEECLSAWPARRAELEPLLRQAMLLRLAYRSTAAPEFKVATREKLMFMAGRETRQALDAQPSEDFVRQTRQRVLRAAGEAAQESLRAVPPPRLAFWMNARRRLLEAAISRPSQSPRGGILAYRSALSAAVVVLAIAVAGLAYFTTQSPRPSVSAELASIDRQLRQAEEQNSAGNPVSPGQVVAIGDKVVAVADKVTAEPSQAAVVQDYIERSRTLTQKISEQLPTTPPEIQAVDQRLSEAAVRVAAARSDVITPLAQIQPTLAPKSTAVPPNPTPNASTPTLAASPSATSSVSVAALAPLGLTDIVRRPGPGDNTAGVTWTLFETESYQFLVPASWNAGAVTFDANGFGKYDTPWLYLAGDNITVLIGLNTGGIYAITADGIILELRQEGGERMTTPELVAKVAGIPAGNLVLQLDHMLASVARIAQSPTRTPTSTPTVVPTYTPTVTPSATPPPPPATPTP